MYEFSDLVLAVGLAAGLFALLGVFAIAAGLSLILREADRSIALARGAAEQSRAQLELLSDELRGSPSSLHDAQDALGAFQTAQDGAPLPAATSPNAARGASLLSLPDRPGSPYEPRKAISRAPCRFCRRVREILGMR